MILAITERYGLSEKGTEKYYCSSRSAAGKPLHFAFPRHSTKCFSLKSPAFFLFGKITFIFYFFILPRHPLFTPGSTKGFLKP